MPPYSPSQYTKSSNTDIIDSCEQWPQKIHNSKMKQPYLDPNFLFSTFFVLLFSKVKPQFKVERKRENSVSHWTSNNEVPWRFHIVLPRGALAQAGPSYPTHKRWIAGPSRAHTPVKMQTSGQRRQAWPPSLPSRSGPNNASSVKPTLTILIKVVITISCFLGTSTLAPTRLQNAHA